MALRLGLNIYYVLFGLWGRGGACCRIDLELPLEARRPRGQGRCPGLMPGHLLRATLAESTPHFSLLDPTPTWLR